MQVMQSELGCHDVKDAMAWVKKGYHDVKDAMAKEQARRRRKVKERGRGKEGGRRVM